MIEYDINFISAVLILASSAIPLYLSFRLKNDLKVLTILLAVFLLSHAAYHGLGVFGYEFLGEKVLEPISVLMLIVFGVAYIRVRKRQEIKA